jgi:hypothetical protein
MRYREISEARRGGSELNPRINPIKTLLSYDNSGYYMSYTAIDKLGINPRSGYNTPIGIYCYPIIDSITDSIELSDNMSRVPYMGESPYVWIFRPKSAERGLIISDYTSSDFDRDSDKLLKYLSNSYPKIAGAYDSIVEEAMATTRQSSDAGYIWNLTRILSRIMSGTESLNQYLGTVLGIDDVVKYGDSLGIITDVYLDEGEYDVEFGNYTVKTVKFDDVENVPVVDPKYNYLLDELKKLTLYKPPTRVNATNPNGNKKWTLELVRPKYGLIGLLGVDGVDRIFISLDRFLKANPEYVSMISESIVLEYDKSATHAKRSAVMWTTLLHKVLGYDYVDDSSGSGLIHANEPIQAVFFNRSIISVVDRITNPNSDNKLDLSSVFNYQKSTKEISRLDPATVEAVFRKQLKNRAYMSNAIPVKFMGHIVLNNSKLKAKIIVFDSGMIEYFTEIGKDTIRIMDNMFINQINALPSVGLEVMHTAKIFSYFIHIHKGIWPEGERAILNKAYNDNNPALILQYIRRVRNKPWPEAEFIILKKPSFILDYSMILGHRWAEGERVLSRLDKERASWVLEAYADHWKIAIDDIGKI